MATLTVTRADAIVEAARQLRKYYGDRLVALYALPEDPYEPEEDGDEIIHLVVVLPPPVHVFDESEATGLLIDQLQHELGFVLFNHTATRGDEPAEHAREEGILL